MTRNLLLSAAESTLPHSPNYQGRNGLNHPASGSAGYSPNHSAGYSENHRWSYSVKHSAGDSPRHSDSHQENHSEGNPAGRSTGHLESNSDGDSESDSAGDSPNHQASYSENHGANCRENRPARPDRQPRLLARLRSLLVCSVRREACGVRVYWNFIQQAEKVQRNRLADYGPGGEKLVPFEAKQQAWRALVERYVKQGLDRKVLVALLFRILSVKLA